VPYWNERPMTDRDRQGSARERAARTKPDRPARKPYVTPRLEEYGHVAKLTQGGGASLSEPNNPIRRMTCL
jgi:hypothetical protein